MDAVVGGESLGHGVAAQLARLGPFGKGNPEVRLLVPRARIGEVSSMGDGERHARFVLRSGPARASGVAFGVGRTLEGTADAGPVDVTVRLELNEWNGAVFPRLVLGEVFPPAAPREVAILPCRASEYDGRFLETLDAKREAGIPPVDLGAVRERIDRSEASDVASVAALASTGEPVLVLCAEATWRRALLASAVDPARFGGGEVAVPRRGGRWRPLARRWAAWRSVVAWRSPTGEPSPWRRKRLGIFGTSSSPTRRRTPGWRPRRSRECATGPAGRTLWRRPATPAAIRALELRFPTREALARAYRALRAHSGGDPLGLAAVREALDCALASLAPELAATAVRTLAETGVVRALRTAPEFGLEVVSSVRGELERAPSFVANREAHEECVRFLTRGKEQSSSRMPAAA